MRAYCSQYVSYENELQNCSQLGFEFDGEIDLDNYSYTDILPVTSFSKNNADIRSLATCIRISCMLC